MEISKRSKSLYERMEQNIDIFDFRLSDTEELVAIVVENEHLDMQDAMSRVLNSQTYEKLQDPRTGLLSQSPLYVYDVLKSRG